MKKVNSQLQVVLWLDDCNARRELKQKISEKLEIFCIKNFKMLLINTEG